MVLMWIWTGVARFVTRCVAARPTRCAQRLACERDEQERWQATAHLVEGVAALRERRLATFVPR
jgi:hypothetical protein